jgi:hypothetical protein
VSGNIPQNKQLITWHCTNLWKKGTNIRDALFKKIAEHETCQELPGSTHATG